MRCRRVGAVLALVGVAMAAKRVQSVRVSHGQSAVCTAAAASEVTEVLWTIHDCQVREERAQVFAL